MIKMFAFRLHEGECLKAAIQRAVVDHQFSAATVISAVGSLSEVTVRMAGAAPDRQDIRTYEGNFEIVSFIGNLGQSRVHLHISFSDTEGKVTGGHLKDGIVHTTVELVLAVDDAMTFSEEVDPQTGFGELKVTDSQV